MSKIIKQCLVFLLGLTALVSSPMADDSPIYHEVFYPDKITPAPALMLLHTSGGFDREKRKQLHQRYVDQGFVVYMPDFFKRHRLNSSKRFTTWTTYREPIEQELTQLLEIIKQDPRVDADNIFAVGQSNGGYWASYLAATQQVNAGASHFGVWKWPFTHNGYPAQYFDQDSHPVLVLHGQKDYVQKMRNVEPQWDIAQQRGGDLSIHVYPDAGHSWDCDFCKKAKYDSRITNDAINRTVAFFNQHRR